MSAELNESDLPLLNESDFRGLLLRTGLPLDDAQISVLRAGYVHIEQLRAMLHRPAGLHTDLALVFAPDLDL